MQVPGVRIQVDSFKRGSDFYFLSHFHADHMPNLRAGWSRGPLYASPVTARLLVHGKKVDRNVVKEIEPGQPVELEAGGKVTVRAFDANHCPGALMFVFETPTARILYTGDFRYEPEIHAALAGVGPIDLAFVDATYDKPHYVFPTQRETIRRVIGLIEKHIGKDLFLGLYTIGKTRLLEALVRRFDRPFYVSRNIYNAYRAMGAGDLVTLEKDTTNFHGYNLGYFSKYFKMAHPDYRSRALVIIPTGWALDSTCRDGYHYVPYSEHCDWRERHAFVDRFRPRKVVNLR